MLEFTYVMLKPDGVDQDLFGLVKEEFEENGLSIVASKVTNLKGNDELVKEHYSHLLDKPFYPALENFMMSGDIMPMIVMGDNAVSKVRALIGPTNVLKAKKEAPDSIRARFGNPDFGPANVIHASDSLENAEIEARRFFGIDLKQPKLEMTESGYSKIKKHRTRR